MYLYVGMKLKRERNQAQKEGEEEEEEETVWGAVSSDGILRLLVFLLYALEPWRNIYGLVTTAGLLPHADMQDASCRGWS